MQPVAGWAEVVEQIAFAFERGLRRHAVGIFEQRIGADVVQQLAAQVLIRPSNMIDAETPSLVQIAERIDAR
jgi:hypothetical protein